VLARAGTPTPLDTLCSSHALQALSPDMLEELAAACTVHRAAAGKYLFRRGDPSDSLFVVRLGRLDVVGNGEVVRALGPGDVLGEVGTIEQAPRSASVIARRDSELLEITRGRVLELARRTPELALALARVATERLRRDAQSPGPVHTLPSTVALVSLGPGPALAAVGERLARACASFGTVALLDESELDTVDGQAPDALWASVLDRAERGHDRVVLVTSATESSQDWTEFCLRSADRVIALAGREHSPEMLTPALRGQLNGCHLLTDADSRTAPALAAWRTALEPRTAHHAASQPDAAAEIARRLCGRAVGLVLSGGGARGLAHIGVLHEIRAAGITIDRIGGASMGSVIGGMYAMDMAPEEIEARCTEDWVRHRPFSDYTWPRHGLIRGERIGRLLDRLFAGLSHEELAREFFCVSCDLSNGELVVHRHGPVADSVKASICIPGFAPPRRLDGRLLVDGGIRNNLPVDVMASSGEGPIIAVDVTALRSSSSPAQQLPSLPETLARLAVLASEDTVALRERYASLVIQPRTEGVGLLDFQRLDQLVDAGRRAGRQSLQAAEQALSVLAG